MKKKLILLITLLLIPIIKVNAATGTINVTASNKNITVGNTTNVTVTCSSSIPIGTCEYTISYDSNKLILVSGQESVIDFISNNSTYKLSQSYTFKAKASGSATITVKGYGMNDFEENTLSTNVSPATINISAATSSGTTPSNNSSKNNSNNNSNKTTYSTNNYLKNLSIEGYTLSPAFNKNTLEYKLKLDDSIETIKILAEPEDEKATVKGNGEQKIDLGENKFEITVTSEKGTTKTYTITINVEDENPIEVKIDKETYTLVKRKSLLEETENYKLKTITINNQEIPTLYNEKTKITLIGLKNKKDNKVELFIYNTDEKTYTKFKEIKIGNISLTVLENGTPNEFKNKVIITIDGNKIEAFKNTNNSKFSLIYAINNETGKTSWYKYDEEENTIQRYEKEITVTKNNNTAKIMILALGITSLTFAILFIITLINKNKKIEKEKNKTSKEKE